MKTVTISISDSEEETVMAQLYTWQSRQAVRFETTDPLLFPANRPLTDQEWVAELHKAEASGTIRLTKAAALARFGA